MSDATCEKSSAVGNTAAMSEALKEIRARLVYLYGRTDGTFNPPALKEIYEIADTALSVPPRNCDVGTTDEQAKRFHSFCEKFQSRIQGMCSPQCPCKDCCDKCQCLIKWAQTPYEEGGAK